MQPQFEFPFQTGSIKRLIESIRTTIEGLFPFQTGSIKRLYENCFSIIPNPTRPCQLHSLNLCFSGCFAVDHRSRKFYRGLTTVDSAWVDRRFCRKMAEMMPTEKRHLMGVDGKWDRHSDVRHPEPDRIFHAEPAFIAGFYECETPLNVKGCQNAANLYPFIVYESGDASLLFVDVIGIKPKKQGIICRGLTVYRLVFANQVLTDQFREGGIVEQAIVCCLFSVALADRGHDDRWEASQSHLCLKARDAGYRDIFDR